MTYLDGDVAATEIAAAQRRAQDAQHRAARIEAAFHSLADRVRQVEEDLMVPAGGRRWKTCQGAAAALRGARIEAAKTVNEGKP